MASKIRFRSEVFHNSRNTWLGSILLIRPLSVTFMCYFTALIAVTTILFCFIGQYTQSATVNGYLTPEMGISKIYSNVNAQVLERRVSEGQAVKKGEVLFVLSTERFNRDGTGTLHSNATMIDVKRASFRSELNKRKLVAELDRRALQRKLEDAERDLKTLKVQLEIQMKLVELGQTQYLRSQELYNQNFIPLAQLQQKEADLLEQRSKLRGLQREEISGNKELHGIESELATLATRSQAELANVERALTSASQEYIENDNRESMQLVAPYDGYITAIIAAQGQTVSTNQVLASIVPRDAKLEAHFFVPSRSVGLVKPGSKVLLRYQAYPLQKFGQFVGVVSYVSQSTLKRDELPIDRDSQEPSFLVAVKIPSQSFEAFGRRNELKAGMLVDADIQLETRRIYEWIFESILGLPSVATVRQ